MRALNAVAGQLAEGKTGSRDLVEQCLERIADPGGEGGRAFVEVDAAAARAQADAADKLRAAGIMLSPLAGLPVSVKDLFDVRGQITRAGSKVLGNAGPAAADAAAVKRLRRAGLVIIGRTNMTEFAYSGLGLNPHYGTPRNPFDRATGRIPGGSSCGAAVSVTDGMALAALGTDTGGSCRIPAALCGLAGFKPTAARVPMAGALALSPTLDSAGPLAPSVACCAAMDAVLSGGGGPVAPKPARQLRLGVLGNYVMEGVDGAVAGRYEAALSALSAAGVGLADMQLPDLDSLPELNAKGGIIAAEAYALHRGRLAERFDLYDPRVSARIMKGADQSAADYLDLLAARRRMMARAGGITEGLDAVVFPATPVIAPPLAELADDENYARLNLLLLRNPSVANFLDRCALSIPVAGDGAPVGLMLMGQNGKDRELFSAGLTVESLIAGKS